jgi:predicted N-acyltransferase
MKMYSGVVVSDLSELSNKDIKAWNEISGSVFTSYDFIRIFEDERIIDIVPRHILVYDESGELVGFAICYIENEALISDFESNCYGKYSKFAGRVVSLKNSLVSFVPDGSAVKSIEVKYEDDKIYEKILDIMEEVVRDENLKQYAIYSVADADEVFNSVLEKRGFSRFFSAFNSYIDIEWDSFDDYVGSLSRPKQIRREIRKNKEMNVKVEKVDVHSEDFPAVVSMINANYEKYFGQVARLPLSFFLKLGEVFVSEIMFFKVTMDGKFVGGWD